MLVFTQVILSQIQIVNQQLCGSFSIYIVAHRQRHSQEDDCYADKDSSAIDCRNEDG